MLLNLLTADRPSSQHNFLQHAREDLFYTTKLYWEDCCVDLEHTYSDWVKSGITFSEPLLSTAKKRPKTPRRPRQAGGCGAGPAAILVFELAI